jgi:hypothetical protein
LEGDVLYELIKGLKTSHKFESGDKIPSVLGMLSGESASLVGVSCGACFRVEKRAYGATIFGRSDSCG